MITRRRSIVTAGAGAMVSLTACGAGVPLSSDARKQIDRAGLRVAATGTIDRLLVSKPEATRFIEAAPALLVFPDIFRGGLIIGASVGDGVWFDREDSLTYFRSTGVSYGLQAGITKFGYVMAIMDQASADYIENSNGWEVGVGPVVTLADESFAKKLSTSTYKEGIVVFFVNQSGFFAGSGIEGTKITQLE